MTQKAKTHFCQRKAIFPTFSPIYSPVSGTMNRLRSLHVLSLTVTMISVHKISELQSLPVKVNRKFSKTVLLIDLKPRLNVNHLDNNTYGHVKRLVPHKLSARGSEHASVCARFRHWQARTRCQPPSLRSRCSSQVLT